MEGLSAKAREAYLSLVYEDEDFLSFFSEASPIGELSLLNMGSPPARRVQSPAVGSLRAIPWVFAWTQNRFYSRPGTAQEPPWVATPPQSRDWRSCARCTWTGPSSVRSLTLCR
jgi:hypothetical protein